MLAMEPCQCFIRQAYQQAVIAISGVYSNTGMRRKAGIYRSHERWRVKVVENQKLK